jgi:hypothetical protein
LNKFEKRGIPMPLSLFHHPRDVGLAPAVGAAQS